LASNGELKAWYGRRPLVDTVEKKDSSHEQSSPIETKMYHKQPCLSSHSLVDIYKQGCLWYYFWSRLSFDIFDELMKFSINHGIKLERKVGYGPK